MILGFDLGGVIFMYFLKLMGLNLSFPGQMEPLMDTASHSLNVYESSVLMLTVTA
jgi:hypothetical protein